MNKVKQLSITTVEQDERPDVWCLNTTTGERSGEVIFSVRTRGDGQVSVIVPVTFLAINLTEQVSKQYLLDSENFRKTVARGGIILVSREDAERMNKVPGAAEEIERLRSLAANLGVLESVATLSGAEGGQRVVSGLQDDSKKGLIRVTDKKGMEVQDRNKTITTQRKQDNETAGVSPRVLAILNEESTEQEKINRLRPIKETLSAIDANYIRKIAKDKDWEKLKKVGKIVLKKLEGAAAA